METPPSAARVARVVLTSVYSITCVSIRCRCIVVHASPMALLYAARKERQTPTKTVHTTVLVNTRRRRRDYWR
ncbi:hypothetical protein Y032_0004g1996 [Ancylostoma ceylanicum]|uniref:Uncharacterized protein n=1 Tax=Ancylostoma ceylanicum TaxID=53326 RepID=A0A016VVW8_9BILA|nr:hypothetical protein Y032_0004g1996 [Ancylostoma ceylanicum]